MHTAMPNVLYCGDNLEVLREYIPDASVDLIYLDPPFNSKRTYNLIYKGSRAQEVAFKDYWDWAEAAPTCAKALEDPHVPRRLRALLRTLRETLVEEDPDLLAYLVMMAVRLVELRRVLKPSGSLYLHCDPTASHYLKVVLDCLFGTEGFVNEIVWQRTNARSFADCWPRLHDTILYYRRSRQARFVPTVVHADAKKLPHTLITGADGLKYQTYELTGQGTRNGETGRPWRGFDPTRMGRHWANLHAVMDELDGRGLIHWPSRGGFPRRRAEQPFEAEERQITVGDVWTDIDRLNQTAKERVGYPTQKPGALLDRIILASSNPGDLILDAFCGCGTSIESAERLGRRWIGIDIARKAVEIVEQRFKRASLPAPQVIWHPADHESAQALAERDPYQFEQWVLRRIGARRIEKRDRGIDGEAHFKNGGTHRVLVSVKGGRNLNPAMVRELRGTIEREGAPIGVLVSMQEPSKEMRLEAARAQFLAAADTQGPIPRIQLLTVAEIFAGATIRAPGANVTQKQVSALAVPSGQLALPLGDEKPGVKKTAPPPAAKVRRAK